jgi:hypothetical protein
MVQLPEVQAAKRSKAKAFPFFGAVTSDQTTVAGLR